jgi:hypothetical protein
MMSQPCFLAVDMNERMFFNFLPKLADIDAKVLRMSPRSS